MKKNILVLTGIIALLMSSCVSTNITPRDSVTEQAILIDAGNLQIPAILTLPAGSEPCPVVIMEHGTGSQKDEAGEWVDKMLAPALAEAGIASLRFDFVW